eukprot:m.159663 g.159663  ORF g.159663 m.159663 type:complete len:87 (-) comp17607_c0_seq6:37-297(-)
MCDQELALIGFYSVRYYGCACVFVVPGQDVVVKVWRRMGGGMMSTNEWHPLYAYQSLAEPLFVKAWRSMGGGMMSTGEYAELPSTR